MTTTRLLICPYCGQKNRVSAERDARAARCGKCHQALFSAQPVEVDEAAFDRYLKTDELPLLVDVWAPWCGPCRMMGPAFESASGLLEPDVRLLKLNADTAPNVSEAFAIRSIPTILLFHKGRLVGRSSGALTAPQIVAWTRQHLPARKAA